MGDENLKKISKDEELSKISEQAVTAENVKENRKVTYDVPLTTCESLHSRKYHPCSPYPAAARGQSTGKDCIYPMKRDVGSAVTEDC